MKAIFPLPTWRRSVPLLLITGALLAWGAHNLTRTPAHAEVKNDAANSVLTVEVSSPRQQTWGYGLNVSGGLQAWQEASVSSELGGLAISELLVDVGSQVKRGQPLARLASETVAASVALQQAHLASARATLVEAQANAARARAIADSGALSAQQIQQAELAEDIAKARLAAAQAALRVDEVRLGQTLIRAVDDGVIAARSATLGAVVAPGVELFRLVRQGRIEWRAELTAEQLKEVKPGLPVELRLSDGSQARGKLRQLAPTLDGHSRKAIAYVDLAPGSTARAGMFGQGHILLGERPALTIPSAALVLRDGHSYVYEVLADNSVATHKVVTGRRQGNDVEILSGVDAKARLVVRGGAFLNPGDHVQIARRSGAGDTHSNQDAPR